MKRRWIMIAIVVAFAALGGGVMAVIWRLTVMPPAWYALPDANDPMISQLADRMEYRLIQETHQIRPAQDVWVIRLSEDHVNAWLATRLRKWMERDEGLHWPEEIGTPQVFVQTDGVRVALPLLRRDGAHFIVATIDPVLTSEGLRMGVVRAALGRLSVPGEPLAALIGLIQKHAPEAWQSHAVQVALKWLQGSERIPALLELSDGRRVQLMQLKLGDGFIDLECRTEPQH